jgi:hypothetical protein
VARRHTDPRRLLRATHRSTCPREAAQIRTRSKAEGAALRRPGTHGTARPARHASPGSARFAGQAHVRQACRSRCWEAAGSGRFLGGWKGEQPDLRGELEVSLGFEVLDAAALECTAAARHTRLAYETLRACVRARVVLTSSGCSDTSIALRYDD